MTARSATTRAAGEFCWVDLKTRDVPATAAFFSAALGWTFAVDPDDWRQATKIAVDGQWVGGVSDLASPVYPPGTPPHIASYLAVDDVDARTAAARQAGAEVVVPPSDVADQGRLASVVDPFGAASRSGRRPRSAAGPTSPALRRPPSGWSTSATGPPRRASSTSACSACVPGPPGSPQGRQPRGMSPWEFPTSRWSRSRWGHPPGSPIPRSCASPIRRAFGSRSSERDPLDPGAPAAPAQPAAEQAGVGRRRAGRAARGDRPDGAPRRRQVARARLSGGGHHRHGGRLSADVGRGSAAPPARRRRGRRHRRRACSARSATGRPRDGRSRSSPR